ncbi:MAG: anthranilate synthase component I [Halobacteriota archaeon]
MLVELEYADPLKLYGVLREEDYPFILESLSRHELKARYTYISANPEFTVEVGDGVRIDGKKVSRENSPFRALKARHNWNNLNEVKFSGGFVGYIAYDAVHAYIDGIIDQNSFFGYYNQVFIYDHILNKVYYFSTTDSSSEVRYAENMISRAKRYRLEDEEGGSSIENCDSEKEEFMDSVDAAKDYIFSGDAFQIVLSREYQMSSDFSPFRIYRNIRNVNPSPYMFLLEFDKDIVGASPETMASVEGDTFKINPIAGTCERGKSEEEDREFARKMLCDEKEKAEHVMLVDLARNDVRKVSRSGSVTLSRYFDVAKYSHVQHIESEVTGQLEEHATLFDAMEASFPAGTLTGAPKVRAMEIIDELEKSKRRVYGGAVGYFSSNGYADMAIAIRMLEIDDCCRIRAGAGIVADSDPEKEFYETERKMAGVMKALEVDSDTDNR